MSSEQATLTHLFKNINSIQEGNHMLCHSETWREYYGYGLNCKLININLGCIFRKHHKPQDHCHQWSLRSTQVTMLLSNAPCSLNCTKAIGLSHNRSFGQHINTAVTNQSLIFTKTVLTHKLSQICHATHFIYSTVTCRFPLCLVQAITLSWSLLKIRL